MKKVVPKSTVISTINIALIKYWGKLTQASNISINSSLSLTLDTSHLVTVSALTEKSRPNNGKTEFKLLSAKGEVISEQLPAKFEFCQQFFARYKTMNGVAQKNLLIQSQNCFPTAAGMASSASGFSALVMLMAYDAKVFSDFYPVFEDKREHIFKFFKEKNDKEILKAFALSKLARILSASSSRSLFPGLVFLEGANFEPRLIPSSLTSLFPYIHLKDALSEYDSLFPDFEGSDQDYSLRTARKFDLSTEFGELNNSCIAYPLFQSPQINDFVKSLSILIIVVDESKKKLSSRKGMIQTVETSTSFPQRVKQINKRTFKILEAMASHDMKTFAEVMIEDSDDFHFSCATSEPSIVYLNDLSERIKSEVRKFNLEGECVGYTFDAGPNPFIIGSKKRVAQFKEHLKETLQIEESKLLVSGVLSFD